MKANELRIGNLVSQNGFFGYVYSIESALPRQEKRFSDKDLVTLFDNGITTVPIDEIKPIPLTEEWLLKFGFNKILGKFVINPNSGYNVCVAIIDNKWYLFNDDCNAECNIICKVETIHRLQNLFFDIWNFELTINN